MLTYYYPVRVKDSQGHPLEGITVEMNYPDEGEGSGGDDQLVTDSEGRAWRSWQVNYTPVNVFASAGGEGTGYNYNSVEVGPTSQESFEPDNYQGWTVLTLTTSSVTPTLTFTATSGTITYDGTRKAIGTVSYNGGNGYAYYLVKTSSGVPNASSTEGTGWVQVNTGGTVYATSSAPSNAGTYYVFLKATAHGNYAAVNPKSGGNKAIAKAAGSTGVATGAMTITYRTTTGTRTVSGNTNTVSVSSSNTSVATVAISGSTITVTRKGYGSATITCSVAAATNYNATTSTFTVNCNKATGSVGTASNPTAQKYKASGTYSFQLAMTGNTGTVTYPTSITVKRGSTTITGWTCTSAGVVTVPAGTNAASYTVTGNVTCAEGTNYYAVTTGQSRTWTVTINTGDNQITVSPTTKTLYYHANHTGYNTATITVSNYKGTVTATSSATSKVTVSKTNNGSFTITYVAAGSATITFTDDGGTNYSSSSATCAVTTVVDTVSTYGNLTITTSPASTQSVVARGTQTTGGVQQPIDVKVTACSQTLTWASGYSETLTDPSVLTVSCAVTTAKTGFSLNTSTTPNTVSVTNNTSTTARNGFVVTLTATGQGNKTVSKAITFNQVAGAKVYANPTVTYTYATFSAAGGTNGPSTLSYSQAYTWNGVSGSGGTITTGATVSYASDSSLYPTGFSVASDFATTGKVTYASRGTTPGAVLNAKTAISVTVTLNGKTKTQNPSACQQQANTRTWGNVTFTISPATPYQMAAAGETKSISISATQTATCTSGATDSYTPSTSAEVTTAATGFSMSSGRSGYSVIVTNNTSTSARGNFVVTVTGTGKTGTNSTYDKGYGKTATSARTFTQAAGVQVYANPVVNAYTYSTSVSAAGVTDLSTASLTYSQAYTWNGVSGSGGTITTGGTLAFTRATTYSWMTAGTNFATTGKINVAARGKYTDYRDFYGALSVTVTLNGKTSASKTCTAGRQSGNTYTDAWNNPSVTAYSYGNIGAAGGTSSPSVTATQSGTRTWANSAGTDTLSNTTFTYSYSMTSGNGFSINTSTGVITAEARGKYATTRTSNTATVTVTGHSKSGKKTATCTQSANTYTDSWSDPSVTAYTYASITAAGGTSAPSVTATQSGTRTWGNSAGTDTLTNSTFTYSYTMTTGNGFTINTSTGVITVNGRGTTIGNARTSNTATVTVTGHSKSGKKTATLTQPGNYVTAVQATSSNSGNLTAPHFSYANIGPGATSASPTLSGGAVYTFSSGSTLFNSSGSPSFGGTASYSRSYTLAESKNGFTAVNATSGVLTATSMGTTVTSARTSGTVTGVLTVTYTHASSYSDGGTVTSSTKSDTATCTQTANALTGLSMSVGTNPIAYNSTTSVTVTATYTSGASKNVSNLSATTYNDTSDPDIVQITKS